MTTGLDVFDTTVQETNLWLKDVMERIGTYDRHSAYSTLRAVLHAGGVFGRVVAAVLVARLLAPAVVDHDVGARRRFVEQPGEQRLAFPLGGSQVHSPSLKMIAGA